ncbi:MAG: LysR family transcriptional regulator [Lachnospiraceae bacterium]|nr:LysR family transcriptional regulator [Lachnospiraceae bacterium]
MNLSQLPYIIAIASTGTLSAAASRLGVSQPALSLYLKELEQETGLELFFRSKRQLIPTPAGRLYIEAAQQILASLDHTKKAISELQTQQEITITAGVSPNRGIAMFASLYPEFHQRFPFIQLIPREGLANELKTLLRQGVLDCAIATHSGKDSEDLQMLPIHSEELVLAVPSFYTNDHGIRRFEELPMADLHDFSDCPFVIPSSKTTQYELIQDIFLKNDFHPRVTDDCSNILVQEAMILSGSHIGLLPSYYIRPDSGVTYFRLAYSRPLIMGFFTRAGHELNEAELYLVYLILLSELHKPGGSILWSDQLKKLLWEFNPVEAIKQGLEKSDGL